MAQHFEALVSVRVAFDFKDPTYVLQLASHQSWHAVTAQVTAAAALSNHNIQLLQYTSADVQPGQILHGHTGRINDVSFASGLKDVLVSASSDGSVRTWDSRAPGQAQQCVHHSQYNIVH